MIDGNGRRIVDLRLEHVHASNIERALNVETTGTDSLKAHMEFNEYAHLSVKLFDEETLLDVKNLKLTFQARVLSEDVELWVALVSRHSDWHRPIKLCELSTTWSNVDVHFKDFRSLTHSFKYLKLIVRRSCKLELRTFRIDGPLGLESLKIVIPWFGRDAARLRARDIAIERLAKQDLAFELNIVELICDDGPNTFIPAFDNHKHIVVRKDPRYAGIFHKESLLEYYLQVYPPQPFSGYVFLDSDVFPENSSWLARIAERLTSAIENNQALWMQPFKTVVDSGTGKAHISFCYAEKEEIETLAVNPGLCWATYGNVLLEQALHFPTNLVTGIADATFVANNIAISDRIPYLPSFSVPSVVRKDKFDWDYLNEDLNHVNHGDTFPHSYAMRDLLWQACIDHGEFTDQKIIEEDTDRFLYFPEKSSPAQLCIAQLMNHERPDSVMAQIYRNFGAPMNQVQHIFIDSQVEITADPRGLDLNHRLHWECARSYFRLYTLGVEKTAIDCANKDQHADEFKHLPAFREMVTNRANHPIILVTAPTAVTYPSLLKALEQALSTEDIVFFTAELEEYDLNRQSAMNVATAPPCNKPDLASTNVSAVAFSRAWWEENQIASPHGLLASENFLDCMLRLVRRKWPDVHVVQGHTRMLSIGTENKTIQNYNNRVTENILSLHEQGFLNLGSIKKARRRLLISPKTVPGYPECQASTVNTLERLESTNGTLFNPYVNTAFCEVNDKQPPYQDKWCGVIHGFSEAPDHFPFSELIWPKLLQKKRFSESLETCAGLFTHSHFLREQLLYSQDWNKDVPINVLPCTTSEPKLGFRADWYWHNPNPQLYFIAGTNSRLHTFFDLADAGFKKTLFLIDYSAQSKQYLQSESKLSQRSNTVTIDHTPPRVPLDEILARFPVFIDNFDFGFGSILSECIVRNTPMIVRRHPWIVEVLGSEYPLFFDHLDEATEILAQNRILEGHLYLANMEKRPFLHPALLHALENSEIYQCL